jgi:hypothetical protein
MPGRGVERRASLAPCGGARFPTLAAFCYGLSLSQPVERATPARALIRFRMGAFVMSAVSRSRQLLCDVLSELGQDGQEEDGS